MGIFSLFHKKDETANWATLFKSIDGFRLEVTPGKYYSVYKADTDQLLFHLIRTGLKDSSNKLSLKGWIVLNVKAIFNVHPRQAEAKLGSQPWIASYRDSCCVKPSKLEKFVEAVTVLAPTVESIIDICAVYDVLVRNYKMLEKVTAVFHNKQTAFVMFDGCYKEKSNEETDDQDLYVSGDDESEVSRCKLDATAANQSSG